jgi:hypothetical protein
LARHADALERRLSMDSTDSGTLSSKERLGTKEARRARRQSERERSKDRRRGGQPGHQGKGLKRDPDPGETKTADPPAECRSCRTGLDGADAVEPRWAQVIDYATAGRDARINWKALSQRIGYVDVASTMKPESQLEPVLGMTRHSTDAVASRGKRG